MADFILTKMDMIVTDKQQGFTFMEIIVAVLLFSITVIGVLEVMSFNEIHFSKNNNLHKATMLLKNIKNSMYTKDGKAFLSGFYNTNTNNTNISVCDGSTTCTISNIVANDFANFNEVINNNFTNASLTISCNDSNILDNITCSIGSIHIITLVWQDVDAKQNNISLEIAY